MLRMISGSTMIGIFLVSVLWSGNRGEGQTNSASANLDAQVRKFLQARRGTWRDLNVPESDGQALYDIILKNQYKNALEIGTSTGHSGIWIAWALAKTGGRLTTIEIDRSRRAEALANFRQAGVAEIVDSRLGDAHTMVPALKGEFDFVFCDADKDWYENYLKATLPKIRVGGCFAAHNVSERRYMFSNRDFLKYLRSLPNLETTLVESGSGMSVSYKKSEK